MRALIPWFLVLVAAIIIHPQDWDQVAGMILLLGAALLIGEDQSDRDSHQ